MCKQINWKNCNNNIIYVYKSVNGKFELCKHVTNQLEIPQLQNNVIYTTLQKFENTTKYRSFSAFWTKSTWSGKNEINMK